MHIAKTSGTPNMDNTKEHTKGASKGMERSKEDQLPGHIGTILSVTILI